ncbi:MAG: YacL family protein [Oceanospirillaceae bacterium]
MEYSFTRNDIGQPVARLNMEGEAFAHWLNIEMSSKHSHTQLAKVALAVEQLLVGSQWQYECEGREFFLELTRDQAIVKANAVIEQADELTSEQDDYEFSSDEYAEDEQDFHVSESGLVASCGLEDFQQLLAAWIRYLQTS